MNDDLISREALKERAETVTLWNGDVRRFVSYETIDNAPTVESQKIVTIPSELIEKLASCVVDTIGNIDWEKAIEAYKARPQGEWIIDGHHYKCSRCGKTLAIMFSETDDTDLIGCPFCLADMRKEEENEGTRII